MPNSSDKGKRGEREFCQLLRENGYGAVRSEQTAGIRSIDESADVITSMDEFVRFEVKRGYNDVKLWSKQFKEWVQTMRDETPDHKVAVLAWRPDYKGWYFFLNMKAESRSGLQMVEGFDDFEQELPRQFGYLNAIPITNCKVEDPSSWKTTGTFTS